ncbi:MAG: electron transport complex subunit RsxG [Gammaproteobacteria bacterium]|nr:electron transport complex subunit RsxG [Gammaproteobacteria bacterium]
MDTQGAESSRARPVRAGLLLAAAATLAVGLVAVVHDLAQPRIEANENAQRVARLAAALGAERYDNDLLQDVVTARDPELLGTDEPVPIHRARLGGEPVAVLIEAVAPDGYAGSIRLLVAVGMDGRLLGVRVLSHKETPGLGDAIDERKSDWISKFAGRSLQDPAPERWRVRKDGGDFDQFTGATVTPRAVVHAVLNALVYFDGHRAAILAAPAGTVVAQSPASGR